MKAIALRGTRVTACRWRQVAVARIEVTTAEQHMVDAACGHRVCRRMVR